MDKFLSNLTQHYLKMDDNLFQESVVFKISTSRMFGNGTHVANVTLTTESDGHEGFSRVEVLSGSQFGSNPSSIHLDPEALGFANRLRGAVYKKLSHLLARQHPVVLDLRSIESIPDVRMAAVDAVLTGVLEYMQSDGLPFGTDVSLLVGGNTFIDWQQGYGDLDKWLSIHDARFSNLVAIGDAHVDPKLLFVDWLKKIGTAIFDGTDKIKVKRNSPMAGVLSSTASVVVTFNSQRGTVVSVKEDDCLPHPSHLNSGEAAVLLHYFETLGGNFLRVDSDRLVATQFINPRVLELIELIDDMSPIVPGERMIVDAPALGAGAPEVIASDKNMDRANGMYIERYLAAVKRDVELLTMECSLSLVFHICNLMRYLPSRLDGLDYDMLGDLWMMRKSVYPRYDIGVSCEGKFVDCEFHMNEPASPSGTIYQVRASGTPVSWARDIMFIKLMREEGRYVYVPMEYRWDGEQGAPFLAFRRWYDSFDALRDVVITPEKLTELMFHGLHPLQQLRAFIVYLWSTENVADRLRQVWELKETHELLGYAFDDFIEKAAGYLVKGQSGFEVEILSAYLEMEMRRTLGEEVVDRILQSAASV